MIFPTTHEETNSETTMECDYHLDVQLIHCRPSPLQTTMLHPSHRWAQKHHSCTYHEKTATFSSRFH